MLGIMLVLYPFSCFLDLPLLHRLTKNKRFASPLGMQTRHCQVRRATEAGSGPQHLSSDTEEITRLRYQFVKRGVSRVDLNIECIPHDARVWRHAQLTPLVFLSLCDIYVTGRPSAWLGHLSSDHRLQATSENKREDRE